MSCATMWWQEDSPEEEEAKSPIRSLKSRRLSKALQLEALEREKQEQKQEEPPEPEKVMNRMKELPV